MKSNTHLSIIKIDYKCELSTTNFLNLLELLKNKYTSMKT